MGTGNQGTASSEWDGYYEDDRAPWDLGRPQQVLAQVADSREITSPVLDSGCGTGEHALMLAERGHEVVGVDISLRAIEQARDKATQRGVLFLPPKGGVPAKPGRGDSGPRVARERPLRPFGAPPPPGEETWVLFRDGDRLRHVPRAR